MGVVHTPGASYGWRARIGLLQPGIVSDTNPYEFYMMAPEGVQMLQTSLGIASLSKENYARAIAGLEAPVQRLLPRKPDVLIQTGIPPLVHGGWGVEETLRQRVAKLTPIPYVTDAAGSIAAMKAVGIRRVVVVSAFVDPLPGLITTYLGHAGIDVVAHANAQEGSDLETGLLSLETVYAAAKGVYEAHASEADGIWITQASMPSVGAIADLERDLGVPVISTAQALMWAALRLVGIDDRITGFGRLFDVRGFAL
jgi:maleate isomerase